MSTKDVARLELSDHLTIASSHQVYAQAITVGIDDGEEQPYLKQDSMHIRSCDHVLLDNVLCGALACVAAPTREKVMFSLICYTK